MANILTVASHEQPAAYWEGGYYELNISFETLREKQWQRLVDALWTHPVVLGPLARRYIPLQGAHTLRGDVSLEISVERSKVQIPSPTAMMTQHGLLRLGDLVLGCDIQLTRSLFECLSVQIPMGMFEGLAGGVPAGTMYTELLPLDRLLFDIALRIYDAAPFKIAVVGYERGCQLPIELRSSPELAQHLMQTGNALVSDDVLQSIKINPEVQEQVRANLRWLSPVVI